MEREKVLEAVEDAVSTGKTVINLEELGCYVKPEVTAEDEGLKEQVESLSRITAAQVYFDFGEERIEKVDRALIETWLVKDGNTYQLDENKVKEYVKSLSSKYDTCTSFPQFTTHSGRKITLNNGENVGAYTGNYRGDYGWCLDNEKTEQVLIDALQEGTKGNWNRYGFTRPRIWEKMTSEELMWRFPLRSRRCGVIKIMSWWWRLL